MELPDYSKNNTTRYYGIGELWMEKLTYEHQQKIMDEKDEAEKRVAEELDKTFPNQSVIVYHR